MQLMSTGIMQSWCRKINWKLETGTGKAGPVSGVFCAKIIWESKSLGKQKIVDKFWSKVIKFLSEKSVSILYSYNLLGLFFCVFVC